ncbi:hypothetical protein D3C72_2246180 [compost metagenome]
MQRPPENDDRDRGHGERQQDRLLDRVLAVTQRRDEDDGERGGQQTAVMAQQQEGQDAKQNARAAAEIRHAVRMAVAGRRRRGFA